MKETIDFQGTGRDYFSASQLKALYKSPGHYQAYLDKIWETTKSLDLGTMIHMAILEPDKFKETYVKMPDDTKIIKQIFSDLAKENEGKKKPKVIKAPRRTNTYAKWKETIESRIEKEGRKLYSDADAYVLDKIMNKMYMTGIIDTFFSDGEAEKTVKGHVTDFKYNFDALAIIDYAREDMDVDLKTTSSDMSSFKWDAKKYGYDIQARLTSAIRKKPFVFIVVQTVEPYDIGVFSTSDRFLEDGEEKINKALDNWSSWSNTQGEDYIHEYIL